jgi:muconate cycloisomerase
MYKAIETILIDIPTIRPHRLSVTTMQVQSLLLVKITSHDGLVGWGEATTIGGLNYAEESPESIKTNIDVYFAPLLKALKNVNLAQSLRIINQAINGNRFAKCAIQTALLDIQAQRLQLPVSELLGGRLRDRLPVLWTLASGDTATDIAEAQQMIAAKRHNAFKLKIGRLPLQQDLEHVIAIKQALGKAVSIRVDVNRAWSELQCIEGIAQLQAAGIDLIEQPCAAEQREVLARLTQRFDVAIMADEALSGPASAYALAQQHAADVFAVKIEQSGGLIEACEVAKIAHLAGIAVYGGTMLEGSIGSIASAHAFATFPDLAFGTELFGPLLLTEEILTTPLQYENFELVVPSTPGLGVTVDENKLEQLRRKV